VKKQYHIVSRADDRSASIIQQFCQANGQILLPLVEKIQSASEMVNSVIHEVSLKALETILVLSAEQVAGPRTPGKASGEIRWHGSQQGSVSLADRKVRVQRPRLRHRTDGEVAVPAYESLRQDPQLGKRMLGAMMRGVSTREYHEVLPEMAATVGVSKSSVSREAIEASAEQLAQLQERRWEEVDLLVIYIDGQRFGEHLILSAVGIDVDGKKHVLGLTAGATENAAAVKSLLTHLREHGLATDRKYLFIIDGAKALRAAIQEVFGEDQPVQRCRNHKLCNVMDELPKEQHAQTLSMMRAAFRCRTAEEGEKRLEQLARFLERDYETAARSLREGVQEMFTLQRLDIPPSLHKCLATTNIIESPHSGVEQRTHRVKRWQSQHMVQRWAASAWLLTERHFRKVSGHRDLWVLAGILGRQTNLQNNVSKESKVA
jgi:transposase-like protein